MLFRSWTNAPLRSVSFAPYRPGQSPLTMVFPTPDQIEEAAKRIAADHRARKKSVPGIGHPFHKSIDPRTARMLDVARECGFFSKHCMLAMALSAQAS